MNILLYSEFLDIGNKNSHNQTKKAAVKLFDFTPITYLLSTSLASCNVKNGFKRFVPHIIRNNHQFSTP